MGFFFPEAAQIVEAPAIGRAAVKAKAAPKAQALGGTGCDACPLQARWPQIVSRQMPVSGNTDDADILVLGEAPGQQEDQQGRAFVGESGKLLRATIPGRMQDRLAFQNTVRCRPEDNRTPAPQEAHACSVHLADDIARLPIKAILGVGGVPLQRAYPGASILRVHGIRFPLRIGGKVVWYFPVLHPAYVLRMGGERSAVAPIFKADIKTFFANVDRWRPARIADLALDKVQVMHDRAAAEAALARMRRPLAVDLETSKLRPFHRDAKILTAAFSDGDTTIAFPIQHEQAKSCTWGLKLLLDTITSTPWIAHNAAFELLWFWAAAAAAGDDWRPGPFDDTMALGRLYHERETVLSLDDLSRVHLGVAVKELSPVDPKKIENYSLDDVLRYCGLDALASALLYRQLHKQVDRDNYQRILASIVSTVAMERAGLPLDPEASERLHQDWTARKQEVAAEAGRIYEVREFERHTQKPFSISNPNDVGQALAVYGRVPLPKTGSGKWSTDDAILEKQCKDHPLVACVHRYREAAKIISTYIDPVTKARQDNADGQLHPGYTTMLTATGRLSSHEPNIQNFPRRRHKDVRRQIVAPDRHLILAFDYGQLEARVIAMASRDQTLCDAIMHGYDVHQHWLDRLLKLYPTYLQTIAERTGKRDPAAVRKAARDAIKTDFVFSSFFGSAPKNCAANIGAPLEIVQQLAEEFWLEFRGVRNWLKARHREYRDTGAIRTLTGRVRRALLWGNEPINCVDFATEALTQRGWVDGHDLEAGDVLLTMNPQSQLLEWQSVTEVKRFPGYSGPVHYLAGKSFSAVTTPEHRWAYYKDGANKALHECTSATLPAWGSIPRVRPFNGPKRAVYSDDWVRLVGWVVTDGCYNHGGGSKQAAPAWDYRRSQECGYSGSQVTICQRKPENITEIDALCSRLPFPVRSKLPNNRGDEAFWHFSGQAGRWFHGMLPERILTPEFLLRLPQAQLEILFETMIKGDGWVDAGQEGFCSGSKAQIDAFQMLSVLSGRLVNVAYHDFSEHQPERYLSMPNVPNSKGAWYARRAKRENVSLGWLQREVKVEQRGMWCPMVPNTFFVARREGKVYITGNTPIQGTAADIVVDAMNAMTEQALRRRDRYLLPRMQIHDDLTFILPDDAELPRYIESISACLVAVRFDWQIVPLTVEAKIGTNWAELEEFAVFTGGYRR